MMLSLEDVTQTNVEALLTTVDQAAGVHHDELTKWILANLEKLTHATRNEIDAAGRPLFEAVYEMFDTIELSFEDDGRISDGFAFVMHPDMVEKMKRMEDEMTPGAAAAARRSDQPQARGILCSTSSPPTSLTQSPSVSSTLPSSPCSEPPGSPTSMRSTANSSMAKTS
jgi:hypothetical protein